MYFNWGCLSADASKCLKDAYHEYFVDHDCAFDDYNFFEFGIKSDMGSAKHATNEEKLRTAIANTYTEGYESVRLFKYNVETSFTEDQINVKINTGIKQEHYDEIEENTKDGDFASKLETKLSDQGVQVDITEIVVGDEDGNLVDDVIDAVKGLETKWIIAIAAGAVLFCICFWALICCTCCAQQQKITVVQRRRPEMHAL